MFLFLLRSMALILLLTLLSLSGICGDLRDILGVTHTGGKYSFTDKPYLIEGAEKVQELGCRTIKLWFSDVVKQYPFHSQWPEYHSLAELAQTPYFQTVFQMPFKTYILETFAVGLSDQNWREGMTPEQALQEQRQFADLTRYLLTTYRGTGKTFILQNWEGDWAARNGFDEKKAIPQKTIEGMIAWFNARQEGVDQARKEIPDSGVKVYHAAEVNRVKIAMEGMPNVVNAVLPHTHNDLVSYSAWDTESDPVLFPKALDFIAANTPDSAAFGAKNLYIGEYGLPENDYKQEVLELTVKNVVETCLQWGCPYIVYWELYCNEPRHEPVIKNEDARGFWLIRPDGSKSWPWGYLQGKMEIYP